MLWTVGMRIEVWVVGRGSGNVDCGLQGEMLFNVELCLTSLHSGPASQFRANLFVELFLLVKTYSRRLN